MNFTPKTEKQLEEENLIAEGTYDFEVVKAVDTFSQAGNAMIKLQLRVYHAEGETVITDYLTELMGFKLRHFADGVGMMDRYEKGTLAGSELTGKSGKVKIEIRRDKSGEFRPQNVVKDYLKRAEIEKVSNQEELPDFAPTETKKKDAPF